MIGILSIYSFCPLWETSSNYNISSVNRKIACKDLKVKSIVIEARAVKPGRNNEDYIEKFRINDSGFELKRHYISVEILDEEHSVYIYAEAWRKIWRGISAEFQVLKFPESDVPKNFDQTHYYIKVFSIMDDDVNKSARLIGHPRITATKKMIEAFRRIATVVPKGWPMLFGLDHLGE